MKKLLIMAAMVLSSVGAFAQYSAGDITIQPKIGLNCTTLTDLSNNDYKAGLVVGVEGEYHINNWLGISLGALYSQQGVKFNGQNGAKDSKINVDYINVPILANFYVAKGLALKAGIQPGFKVSNKFKYDGASLDWDKYLDIAGTNIGKFRSVDLAIPLGISYEYAGFCIDARYNVAATNAFKDVTIAGQTYSSNAKNEVFQLTFGYKFKL